MNIFVILFLTMTKWQIEHFLKIYFDISIVNGKVKQAHFSSSLTLTLRPKVGDGLFRASVARARDRRCLKKLSEKELKARSISRAVSVIGMQSDSVRPHTSSEFNGQYRIWLTSPLSFFLVDIRAPASRGP